MPGDCIIGPAESISLTVYGASGYPDYDKGKKGVQSQNHSAEW